MGYRPIDSLGQQLLGADHAAYDLKVLGGGIEGYRFFWAQFR